MTAPNLSLDRRHTAAARLYGGHMRTLGAVNTDVLEPADRDKNPRTMKIIAAVAAYNMKWVSVRWEPSGIITRLVIAL